MSVADPHRTQPRKVIDVMTGEIADGGAGCELHASALGSCVAIAGVVPRLRYGVLAHVMLPGRAPHSYGENKTRYADNAVTELLALLAAHGAAREETVICLAGAGNVLKRADDTICRDNIAAVKEALARHGLKVTAKALGGHLRRSLVLDIAHAQVLVAEGDGAARVLWQQAADGGARR
ncbi:MAG TPA: chemotaxis protein CheD [bacterium]|nr:chemotaxis protein CheD [bacterium]